MAREIITLGDLIAHGIVSIRDGFHCHIERLDKSGNWVNTTSNFNGGLSYEDALALLNGVPGATLPLAVVYNQEYRLVIGMEVKR